MVRIEIGGRPIVEVSHSPPGSRRNSIKRKIAPNKPVNWGNAQPRLVITSDTDDFDEDIMYHFQEEGYRIWYLAYGGDHEAYKNQLRQLADPLELGEQYAIIAYGDAAALCLEACQRTMPKLCALVTYYPPYMPKNSASFPPSLLVEIHLAGSQTFGTRLPFHRYPGTQAGFAESDLEEFDAISAGIAWSRTLGTLRRGFGIDVNLEPVRDQHLAMKFESKDVTEMMDNTISKPYVNHVPTMTGGIGTDALHRFYRDFFMPGNPPSLKTKLLSRTTGTDRIVDEMLVKFRHTVEIPWLLPGIPPTDKEVEVVMVSVVCIRGSKVYHEHVHWDQATVLVQIGLLDPSFVPKTFRTTEKGREKEVKRLPVCGREAARKVVDETDGPSNELIANW